MLLALSVHWGQIGGLPLGALKSDKTFLKVETMVPLVHSGVLVHLVLSSLYEPKEVYIKGFSLNMASFFADHHDSHANLVGQYSVQTWGQWWLSG